MGKTKWLPRKTNDCRALSANPGGSQLRKLVLIAIAALAIWAALTLPPMPVPVPRRRVKAMA
jgi:hypothetical protein